MTNLTSNRPVNLDLGDIVQYNEYDVEVISFDDATQQVGVQFETGETATIAYWRMDS